MSDCITGNQFKIIANAKQALLDSTNIDASPNEMACLDDFLFRCWQMGWLDKYEKDLVEVVRCKNCRHYDNKNCKKGLGYCMREEEDGCFYDALHGVFKDNDFCSYGERKDGDMDDN